MTALGLFFVLLALVLGALLASYVLVLWRRGVTVVRAGEQPVWPRLGLRHASDPDHLVAVTSLVAADDGDTRRAARIGAWWASATVARCS